MGIFRRRSKDLFTIPEPVPAPASAAPATGGFRMVVVDCFFIKSRGLVAVGVVEAGSVRVRERVTVERAGEAIHTFEIAAIELAPKVARLAATGEALGLLFRGADKDEIVPGDVIRT